MKKTTKIIISIALVFGSLLSLCSCTGKKSDATEATTRTGKKIDAREYVHMSFEGFDGYAHAELDVEYERLEYECCAIPKYVDYLKSNEDYAEKLKDVKIKSLEDVIVFKLITTNQNLKNGDKVIVEIDVTDTMKALGQTVTDFENVMGFYFDTYSFEFTVSGCKQGEYTDLFPVIEQYIKYNNDALDVGVEGESEIDVEFPYGFECVINDVCFVAYNHYTLSVIKDNKEIGKLKVRIDDEFRKDYSSGEKYKVILENAFDDDFTDNGIYFAPSEKEYTVPELPKFIQNAEDLTETDMDTIKSWTVEDITVAYPDYELVDVYFGTRKISSTDASPTKICLVYAVSNGFGVHYIAYDMALVRNPDGTIAKCFLDFMLFEEDLSTLEERMAEDSDYTFEKM